MIDQLLQSVAYYGRRTFRLKDRYIYTRDKRLRLRVLAVPATLCLLAGASFGVHMAGLQNGAEPQNAASYAQIEASAGEMAHSVYESLTTHRDPEGQIRRSALSRNMAGLKKEPDNQITPQEHALSIAKGDTVAEALQRAGVSGDDAAKAVKEISRHVNPRAIRAGQKIDLRLEPDDLTRGLKLAHMSMAIDPVRTVVIEPKGDDFKAVLEEKDVNRQTYARVAVISSSLYGSAARAGIPSSITAQAIKLFSHDVDFQRDIRAGDRLEVYYDAMATEDGFVTNGGDILFARLNLGERKLSLYRYEKNGTVSYYDEQGRSIKKALLRTPIDGVRVTSGFGMRRHPLLGYTKMHKGIDFGAPTGTPIYASGDGVIDKMGWVSGYGKYIRIRHSGTIKTAYGHMSRFASIKQGSRVKQGQLIGYVGSTGRSTGPHLHYEVIVNGAQVNPKSQTKMAGDTLSGKDLKRFKDDISRMQREYNARKAGLKFASSTDSTIPARSKDTDL